MILCPFFALEFPLDFFVVDSPPCSITSPEDVGGRQSLETIIDCDALPLGAPCNRIAIFLGEAWPACDDAGSLSPPSTGGTIKAGVFRQTAIMGFSFATPSLINSLAKFAGTRSLSLRLMLPILLLIKLEVATISTISILKFPLKNPAPMTKDGI